MFSIREERTAHLTLPMRRAHPIELLALIREIRSIKFAIGPPRNSNDHTSDTAATDWVNVFWFEICDNLAVEGAACTQPISHEKPWICAKYATAFDTWVRTMAMIWQSRMRSETASIPNGNKWMALCHPLWALWVLRWPSPNQYFTLQLGVTINNLR